MSAGVGGGSATISLSESVPSLPAGQSQSRVLRSLPSLVYSDSLSHLTSNIRTDRYELVLKLNGKWLPTDNFVFLSTSLIMFLLVLKYIN